LGVHCYAGDGELKGKRERGPVSEDWKLTIRRDGTDPEICSLACSRSRSKDVSKPAGR
jgi:hypothetical protein